MTKKIATKGNMRLPLGLLRAICRQPIRRQDNYLLHMPDLAQCFADTPLVVIVVPGFADSYKLGLLDALCAEIRRRIPTRLAPFVGKVPVPWPIQVDIPTYVDQIHNSIESNLKLYPGCRLALVAFSLGGAVALYYLSKYGSQVATDHRLSPLVITLASPLYGSQRFRDAFDTWQRTDSPPSIPSIERIVKQLEYGSSIMTAVQDVLVKGDVHLLLSYDDPVVDHYTALPPWFSRVAEFDTQAGSSLKAHFGFPQNPSVIDEVVALLGSHAEGCSSIPEGSKPSLSLAKASF